MNPKGVVLGRRQDIQILRAVAVVLVVFYHLEFPFFENGFLGVDVFFVISGYLMATLYDRGSVLDFYKRRVDRLLPAYCFAIALTAVVAYFVLIPADFSQLFDQAVASLIFAPNFHFWSQTSYFEKDAFRPLLNLWSLGVEVQFYVLVPFVYVVLRKRPVLLGISIAAAFIACLIVQIYSPKTSFFMMPLRIWEFLFGAIVAWFWKDAATIISKPVPLVQYLVLLLLIAFTLLVPISPESGSLTVGHPGFAALFVCMLTSVIIGIGMPADFEASAIGRQLAKLGDYSYSIYLVHFPVIVMWNYSAYGGTTLGAASLLDGLVIVLITSLFSFISYNFIETRSVRFTRTVFARLAIPIGMAAVVAGSYYANLYKYTEYQRNIFAAQDDRSAYRCGRIFRVLNPRIRTCEITGAEHQRKVLLVGNSHADSIKTHFAEIANDNKISVYFYAQNNPLIRFKSNSDAVIEDARALDVDAIVLHFDNDSFQNSTWIAEFERFIAHAITGGVPVAVLAPVPTYGFHIPHELYLLSSEDKRILPMGRQTYLEQSAAFRAVMSRLDNEEISVYDPTNILCAEGPMCEIVDKEGRPYYFDTNHLTLTGSALLRPLFQKMVEKIKHSG